MEPQPPQWEERSIGIMDHIFRQFQEKGGQEIWPGFHLADQSILFHFQNRHAYAFGLNNPSDLWEPKMVEGNRVLYCSRYPNVLPLLHPHFRLGGEKVFVFHLNLVEDSPFLPLLTFIHERFHFHQFQFFQKEQVTPVEMSDYQDIDRLTAMEMEYRLLRSFLEATDQEMKQEYLKNFLAVSEMRRRALHPHSRQWEDHQQKMEGLADYVSVKTFQTFSTIPDFHPEKWLLKMKQMKNPGTITTQDAIKGRHYFVGAALGWALDYYNINDWKLKIEKEKLSLQQLLEETLPESHEQRKKRFFKLKVSSQWVKIQKEVERNRQF